MSVLVTYVALTGEALLTCSKMLHSVRMWLKSQYLISEEDVEVLEMWNVILTKFDMFIQDLIYLLFMGRGIKNVSYTFVILQTTNSNTSEYQQKQAKCQNFQITKLCICQSKHFEGVLSI